MNENDEDIEFAPGELREITAELERSGHLYKSGEFRNGEPVFVAIDEDRAAVICTAYEAAIGRDPAEPNVLAALDAVYKVLPDARPVEIVAALRLLGR